MTLDEYREAVQGRPRVTWVQHIYRVGVGGMDVRESGHALRIYARRGALVVPDGALADDVWARGAAHRSTRRRLDGLHLIDPERMEYV